MPLSCNLSTSNPNCNKFGYEFEWYQCNCCPYGYHIDLDFVRYCDSIGQSERTASIKRRKDRRRQRQSMDVMLGLTPPITQTINEPTLPQLISCAQEKLDSTKCALIQDTTLNDAVIDFERTFQRSKVNHYQQHNLPDVTAVSEGIRRVSSISSISSASGSSVTILPEDGAMPKEFDSVSIESNGLSPMTLQNIREQMAVSLKRMRQLEEQVKIIPILEIQLSAIKAEKEQLLRKLQEEEKLRLNNINYINNNVYSRTRSRSLTQVDSGDGNTMNERNDNRHGSVSPVPPRRDFGVMCGVLTRNIGVGHQTLKTKSVSTTTPRSSGDKWLPQKLDFLIGSEPRTRITITKGTQTLSSVSKNANTQTVITPSLKTDNSTQTRIEPRKTFNSIGVSMHPNTFNAAVQTSVPSRSIGISDDTIRSILCPKCAIPKETVAVNTDEQYLSHSVSLAQLSQPKIDVDELEIKTRTIGCQYDSRGIHKYTQHETKSASRSCQYDLVKSNHKGIQSDIYFGTSRSVDTSDLLYKIERGCVTDVCEKTDTACNTSNGSISEICEKSQEREKLEPVNKKDDATTPSRIPRFQRQTTYTKIPAPVSPGLSGLDLSPKASEETITTFEKLKQHTTYSSSSTSRLVEESTSTVSNGDNTKTTTLVQLSENVGGLSSQVRRKKAVPSKEMQAAMKVLNDSLQKGQTKNIESHLKNAISIILDEWFKISSLVTANPLDVEDYLDSFEDLSSGLLEYIVNAVDTSGNTAMHYAVSHGNFDVVSILLDSKVCDINKQNEAGYTSVMLLSLAEMRSETDAHVVKRLFSLADVNVRAKKHGQTALMLAVSHGRLDMVKMLLEAGADINIQDEDGSTALMCASEHGHIEIVKYFLNHKDCDSTIIDVDGSTALKIAMDAGYRHIGVLLYAHERNLHGPAKHKRSKSASASPKTPSSPLPIRMTRALPSSK